LSSERIWLLRRAKEQCAGAADVAGVSRVVEDGKEELRGRVRPAGIIRERTQDANGRTVVAAQYRADSILGCGLRGSRRRQRHHDAHDTRTRWH
jgi:hypothetical protein